MHVNCFEVSFLSERKLDKPKTLQTRRNSEAGFYYGVLVPKHSGHWKMFLGQQVQETLTHVGLEIVHKRIIRH